MSSCAYWEVDNCNKTKGHIKKYDTILNCTKAEHRVTDWLKYEIKPYPKEKVKITPHSPPEDHLKILNNTLELLLEIYNEQLLKKHLKALTSDKSC